jgi:endothelin-converting enzyme
VADAGKIGPAIGLDAVIKGLVPSDYPVETMLLAFPDFLANISQTVAQTSKATVQSYLIWNTITTYQSYVEGPEVEPITRFRNVLAGQDPETKTERWKTCLNYVDNTVGWILSRFFIEAAFSEDAKKFGDEIINDIKQQFVSKLNGLSWMDESVKKLAVNKVHNIEQKIGYPTTSPDIMNPEALRDWYSGLTITESFFNNSLSSNLYSVNKTWSDLGKPVDHGQWYMQADTVNAYYSPVGNEIVSTKNKLCFHFLKVGAEDSGPAHKLS